MFREMRRKKQQLSEDETISLFKSEPDGVLSVIGDDGYPYGVPVNFVYQNGKIWFHCAKEGHKLDAIKNNDKVCFTVVDKRDVVPEEYTTYYTSAIAFGRAHIIENREEALSAHYTLCQKFYSHHDEEFRAEVEKAFDRMYMVQIDVEYITGKEGIELTRMRNEFPHANRRVKG